MQNVDKEVEKTLESGDKLPKRCNFHYDSETRAKIGRFAAENGNKRTVEKFHRWI